MDNKDNIESSPIIGRTQIGKNVSVEFGYMENNARQSSRRQMSQTQLFRKNIIKIQEELEKKSYKPNEMNRKLKNMLKVFNNLGDYKKNIPEEDANIDQFNKWSKIRMNMYYTSVSFLFSILYTGVIVFDTITIIIMTIQSLRIKFIWNFELLSYALLTFYIMHIGFLILIYRKYFLNDGWRIFDLIMASFNLMHFLLQFAISSSNKRQMAAIVNLLRSLSAFRILRIVSLLYWLPVMRNLSLILLTMVRSIKSMLKIMVILLITVYIFALIGTGLYGEDDQHFENLFESLFTLCLVMTLDDWSDIARNGYERGNPSMFAFLFIYILLVVLILLNLCLAVIVDSFSFVWLARKEERKKNLVINVDENKPSDIDDDIHIDLFQEIAESDMEVSDQLQFKNSKEKSKKSVQIESTLLLKEKELSHTEDMSRPSAKIVNDFFVLLNTLDFHYQRLEMHHTLLQSMVEAVDDVSNGVF